MKAKVGLVTVLLVAGCSSAGREAAKQGSKVLADDVARTASRDTRVNDVGRVLLRDGTASDLTRESLEQAQFALLWRHLDDGMTEYQVWRMVDGSCTLYDLRKVDAALDEAAYTKAGEEAASAAGVASIKVRSLADDLTTAAFAGNTGEFSKLVVVETLCTKAKSKVP